jgi:hypothetical protein
MEDLVQVVGDIMPGGNTNTLVNNVASFVLHLIVGLSHFRANKPAATC